MTKQACIHHWVLPATGVIRPGQTYDGTGIGYCKKCGAERRFCLAPTAVFNTKTSKKKAGE